MYKALTTFKVQNDAGVTRIVKRGDPVPEAAGWSNVQAYLKRQWIEEDDDAKPRRTPAAPKPVAVAVEPPAAPPEPPAEEPEEDEGEEELELYTEKELNRMSKKELQELAETLDIDPDQTKADLAACILLAQE